MRRLAIWHIQIHSKNQNNTDQDRLHHFLSKIQLISQKNYFITYLYHLQLKLNYNCQMTQTKQEKALSKQKHQESREKGAITFKLTEQQRNSINKRLLRGFTLVKLTQLPTKLSYTGEVQYKPVKRERRTKRSQLVRQVSPQYKDNIEGQNEQSDQGEVILDHPKAQILKVKSKQAQIIKQLIDQLRSHEKFNQFSLYLKRIGMHQQFLQIENEAKRNLLTLSSFVNKIRNIFKLSKEVTYDYQINQLLEQLAELFQQSFEAHTKEQFQIKLEEVQASMDEVTVQLQTIQTFGNFYHPQRQIYEKGQNYDENYLLFLAQSLRQLPRHEMAGVYEIVYGIPLQQITHDQLYFQINTLSSEKIKRIGKFIQMKQYNMAKSKNQRKVTSSEKNLFKQHLTEIRQQDEGQREDIQGSQHKQLDQISNQSISESESDSSNITDQDCQV